MLAQARLDDGREFTLRRASPDDTSALLLVISEAFGARPPVDPPPPALSETAESLQQSLNQGFAVVAEIAGEPAGAVVVVVSQGRAWITRVSVRPAYQRHGIANTMVEVVLDLLATEGAATAELIARSEFPEVLRWWHRRGFVELDRDGTKVHLARQIPVLVEVPTAAEMQQLGARLAPLMQAGDLIVASGDLGAGKTTFTQGLAAGMQVSGPVISPTFVLSRIHQPIGEGPRLVHVDAYRLGSAAELEDLDLPLEDSVTLVEWGSGVAEDLNEDRLDLAIRRTIDPDDETRWVFLTPIGPRWESARADLEEL